MGWRFRKSFSFGKGFRINVSKRGVGMSFGSKGFRIGVNSRGVYTSTSIPGLGLSRVDYLTKNKKHTISSNSFSNPKPAFDSVSLNPVSKELSPKTGIGCLWSIITFFLFLKAPTLGFTSLGAHLLAYYLWRKSSKGQAWKFYQDGNKALKKDNKEMALEKFVKVIELQPQIISLYPVIADLYNEQEKYDKAIFFYKKYLNENENDLNIKLKLCLSFIANKQYHEAVKLLQSLPCDIRNDLTIINMLACCFIEMNQFDLALEILEKGPIRKRTVDENMLLFRYLLGLCYKKLGDTKKAVQQFKKVYAEDMNFHDIKEQLKELNAL
ncbi:DUF4236 domain-containing protein [Carboxydocella sp. ULO1]|uniref:DUF4236 domain-containing protein n=1 Tax=Carboxydocella sp. ULO1 TaxID=1926599 RepID=UPI0009AC6352|nr:DUF4236 domain-containing protein [Carboxydocella sp. ULO1]